MTLGLKNKTTLKFLVPTNQVSKKSWPRGQNYFSNSKERLYFQVWGKHLKKDETFTLKLAEERYGCETIHARLTQARLLKSSLAPSVKNK